MPDSPLDSPTPEPGSPAVTAKATEPASAAAPKQENAILNLLLNVLLPVTVLSYLSKEGKWYSLGPQWALVVAVAMPVGYQIYDWFQRRKMNLFSIIGLVSVLLTGGLGLLQLSAKTFALKEASIPLVLGMVFLLTHKLGKPMSKALLMNPDLMDVKKIERKVAEQGAAEGLNKLMWQTTWLLALSFLLSAVMNYFLALWFLDGKVPGSEEYNQGIAKQTGWGFAVIGLPMMGFLLLAFFRLLKGLQKLTGLEQEQLLLPR